MITQVTCIITTVSICFTLFSFLFLRYRRSTDHICARSLSHHIDLICRQSLLWMVCALFYLSGMVLYAERHTYGSREKRHFPTTFALIIFFVLAFPFSRRTGRDSYRFTNYGKNSSDTFDDDEDNYVMYTFLTWEPRSYERRRKAIGS